jgi:hypothetical protein
MHQLLSAFESLVASSILNAFPPIFILILIMVGGMAHDSPQQI